jgi:hypothetical protein
MYQSKLPNKGGPILNKNTALKKFGFFILLGAVPLFFWQYTQAGKTSLRFLDQE